MTECPKCNGRGTVGYFHIDHFVDIECDRCNGSGEVSEVEMTNEEWRKTCSAEEFTEELAKVVLDLVSWNNDPKPSEVRNILKAWLKQPHTEKGSDT